MPKVLKAGSGWKSVPIPGDFAANSDFQYLAAFQELDFSAQKDNVVGNETGKRKVWAGIICWLY